MNFLNNIKEKAKKAYGEAVPPPVHSVFEKDGRLTPQEFIEAGDKLVSVSGCWQWKGAKSGKKENKYLHESKQVLWSQLISRERLNKEFSGDDIEVLDLNKIEVNEEIEEVKKDEKVEAVEVKPQLLDSDDENDIVVQKVDTNLRTYTAYISYDNYYHTPRFWLTGVDHLNQPLTIDQIYEDISSDYKGKTVTNEYNQYEQCQMASIHPCKHASAIHKLYTQAKQGGEKYQVEDYFAVFFKFMGSVMPSIQFDYTYTINM